MALTEDFSMSEGWYSDTAATFGDRVAGAREAIGLNQSELAARLGVKLKTVRGWEEDLAEPRANKLQMLSGVLNVSVGWLLTGTGEGLEAPEAEDVAMPGDLNSILTEMRTLRSELTATGDKLARLEKRLRRTVEQQP
ncbi:MAG: helix-turn-helix transcriptional regulator [Pseudomonadota bacterium]